MIHSECVHMYAYMHIIKIDVLVEISQGASILLLRPTFMPVFPNYSDPK